MKTKKLYMKTALIGMLILLSVSTAYATDSVDVTLPVSQEIMMEDSHDKPESTTFHYELSTEQEDAPMPSGSVDGEYDFSISGMDSEVKIPLHFTHAGVYHYTLHQLDKDTEYCICDHTCYECTVYVQNEPSGDLSVQMIVEDESDGKKCGEILFRTAYRDIPDDSTDNPNPEHPEPEHPEPNVPQEPDGSTPDTPSSPESASPQTGDSSHIAFWVLTAASSLVVLISLPILRKSKRG